MRILLFLILCFGCHATGYLFYLQDAGETYALLPVAERLKAEGEEVAILVGGTARGIAQGRSIEEFGLLVEPSWERSRLADPAAVRRIVEELDPEVFISGVAFELQGQLYEACREKGIQTIAFWDNFSPDGQDAYFKTAHRVQRQADRLWVPSGDVAKRFADREGLVVVGHPSLEKWVRDAAQVDVGAIRARLGLSGRTVLFVGGYGPLYEEAFKLFLEAMQGVEGLGVLIQSHPKFGGRFESEMTKYRILHGEVSTIEAVAAVDVVFCHLSTVGFQASFLGKPVVYFIPEGQSAPSFASNQVNQPQELKAALKAAAAELPDLPTDSVTRCLNNLVYTCKTID